jgi:hypothetical protein
MMFCCVVSRSYGWGVWGHQHINRAAVFALPASLRALFFQHVDFITMEASIPDVRKYTLNDKREGPRHYIDLESFGDHPFAALPEKWDSAVARYGSNKLYKAGILPWYAQQMLEKLTQAFRDRDKVRIFFLSADLAHYIGDAYMPLHTSLNHDGQLTGQRGVHALWESLLPEMFGRNYNLHVQEAQYLKDPTATIWGCIQESHALVPRLLKIEKDLLESWPENRIYEMNDNGQPLKNKYGSLRFSRDFATAYHRALGGMVEDQMRRAIATVSSLWYTAWINAGKPDLSKLDDAYLWRINRKPLQFQYHLWVEKGKLVGLKPDLEF